MDLADVDSDVNISSLQLRIRSSRGLQYCADAKEASNVEGRFLNKVLGNGVKKCTSRRAGYIELALEEFSVFDINNPELPVSLHTISGHNHEKSLAYAFRGRASQYGISQILDSVMISRLQIGCFADFGKNEESKISAESDSIYLQSKKSASRNCHYVLRKPADKYSEIFYDFQWLVTFTKHVADYMQWATNDDHEVHLDDFRAAFAQKMQVWHEHDAEYHKWHAACSLVCDFRQHITNATHAHFVFEQFSKMKGRGTEKLLSHPLWDECAPQCLGNAINETRISQQPTFVTPLVAKCFLTTFPEWSKRKECSGDLTQVVQLAPQVLGWQKVRSARLGLNEKSAQDQSDKFEEHNGTRISMAALLLERAGGSTRRPDLINSPGQLVGKAVVIRDGVNRRFAYVDRILEDGLRMQVKWLVLPNYSICDGRSAGRISGRPRTFYPIGNELFWSDECSCDPVLCWKVVAVHTISVQREIADPGHELFVHRQYISQDYAITEILQEHIKLCPQHDMIDYHSLTTHSSLDRTMQLTQGFGQVLSLFSGAGLLDSGFAAGAGGLFKTIFAADCNHAALRSFMANHHHDQSCQFHNQDTNVLLKEFCRGVRTLPEITLLIAGCPCQGFSRRNPDRNSDKSRKNCSMLTNTLAWIDLFRPKMVLIENVPDMDPVGQKGGVSAAGQAISFLVSLGYQARLAILRASDYGAPTSRKRLFIIATTPGIPLPKIPSPTHGKKLHLFEPVGAGAATLDLARIENDRTFINPSQPHHVPFERLPPLEQRIISKIPTVESSYPNNLSTVKSRLKSIEELRWYDNHSDEQKGRTSSAWCRMNPNKEAPTILTKFIPCDARGVATLHWLQNRLLSLMEFRRFHGVPDDYVLVGTLVQQLHHIGNSVNWMVAFVLGKAYAEA